MSSVFFNDRPELRNCKYKDSSYLSNLDADLKLKCILLFHLNINSISKHFDKSHHLINELKLQFDILGFTKSRILKSQSCKINISLQNYVIE